MSATEPNNCFVAIFDILGFKALRAQLGTRGLHELYSRGVAAMVEHAAAGSRATVEINGQNVSVPRFGPNRPQYRIFSDTAMFFTADDSFQSFLIVVHSSFCLLQFGFSGSKTPFRGAIGWGDLIADNSGIVIGSALEDAYAGEGKQAWAGCVLTDACQKFALERDFVRRYRDFHLTEASKLMDECAQRTMVENAERLVEYPVPFKRSDPTNENPAYSASRAYAIDWTIRMYEDASSKSFGPSELRHAQTIHSNTVAFEKWARSRRT